MKHGRVAGNKRHLMRLRRSQGIEQPGSSFGFIDLFGFYERNQENSPYAFMLFCILVG